METTFGWHCKCSLLIVMKKYISNLSKIVILVTCVAIPKSWSANLKAQLKQQGDTINFEISGQKNWDYDLKKIKADGKTKIQLQVKGLDSDAIKNLKSVPNQFISAVNALPNSLENSTTVEFILVNDSIETFDYLTDQPSKLIVDFYKSDEPKTSKTDSTKEKSAASEKKSANKNKLAQKNSTTRTPADISFLKVKSDDNVTTFIDQNVDLRLGLFDGADEKFKRFNINDLNIQQAAVIKGLESYYLNFPMLNPEYTFWSMLKKNPPQYSFQPANTEENKQVRLLHTLFTKKRPLVLKKTSQWFEKKYPQSKYLESVYFMNADAMLELWRETKDSRHFDSAQYNYEQAILKYPQSALTERASLQLGMMNIDKKDYLTAIRKLTSHITDERYEKKTSHEYAKLGLAYAMLMTNKLEDGLNLLNQVENQAKDELTRAEAGFRRGDFYFHNLDYPSAIRSYTEAAQKYPQYTQLFPSAKFNKMEAEFRFKKPEAAHKSALDFVQNFPSHEFAPYALTRVGELLEVLGADQSRSVGAFLETHFRYGDNLKTVVARLHLLSTRMKSMKQLEVDQTLEKMNNLVKESDLQNIEQFKASMVADGFSRRKEYEKAIDMLTQFYQKEPNKPDSHHIKNRIVANINRQLKHDYLGNNYKKVLKTYQKYEDTWLKNNPRVDSQFYLADAHQNIGSYYTALTKFQKIENQLKTIENDKALASYVKATEDLPLHDQINLRQAICLYETEQYQKASEKLKAIKNPTDLSDQEQIQRVHYAALIYEQKEDYETAIKYLAELVKVWSNKNQLLIPSALKLADLYQKDKKFDLANEKLESLLNSKLNSDSRFTVLKKLSEVNMNQKNNERSIKNLTLLMEEYADKKDISAEIYQLGNLHYVQGEYKKAQDIWGQIDSSKSQFWAKLAQEKIKDTEWTIQNKKYLKRIPAMSKSESEVSQ